MTFGPGRRAFTAPTLVVMTNSDVGHMPIAVLAADIVARVAADADLWQLAAALVDNEVGVLVIGDGDHVTGVVSERDVVRALAARRDPSTTSAADLAHTHLVWCDAGSLVADVAEEMMEHYIRHVLVEEHGHIVGIVSARDLLGAYAAAETSDDDA